MIQVKRTKTIETEAEYQEALKTAESLMTAQPGTSEGEQLEILSALVENYEKAHYRIEIGLEMEAALSEALSHVGGKVELPRRTRQSPAAD